MVTTSTPSNEAELQLYRVLQRASLLMYYDTLLEMGKEWLLEIFLWISKPILNFRLSRTGGDDVQQLCDAGEEEFLEIMALVGMATKPLHVRRFQKSLAEWVNNPTAFQTPLSGIGLYCSSPPSVLTYWWKFCSFRRFIPHRVQSGTSHTFPQPI